ncbi:MAG: hypothetical protein HN904_00675 [Victivallales bacterium]|nr:hypothetical protein [Victivallales bacterium]
MKQSERYRLRPGRRAGAYRWRVLIPVSLALLLVGCEWSDRSSARDGREERWQRQGRCLVQIPFQVPASAAARTLRFERQALKTHRLYLRSRTDRDDFLYIDYTGEMWRRGESVGHLRRWGELVLAEDRVTLYVDGHRITQPTATWNVYWETTEENAPPLTSSLHARTEVTDGFMRHVLASAPCKQVEGNMALAQHGGGMARDESEMHSYDFQRAANPFSVRGSGGGALVYGEPTWTEYLAEARFYFGIPKTGHVVDRNTVPTDTDMLVSQGNKDGLQIAFGWVGIERRFCLLSRQGDAAWEVLARHQRGRPPLTNWVRIGIAVRDGCRVEGWLDGARVLRTTLDERLTGPCRVSTGAGLVELDDVRIHSLPLPPPAPQPLLVTSRAFAGKQEKNKADPTQFGQWATGNDTFRPFLAPREDGGGAGIRTRQPLIGPWQYDSRPYDESLGELPPSRYRYLITQASLDTPTPGSGQILARLDAVRDAKGWTLNIPGWKQDKPLFPLRFRRTEQGQIEAQCAGVWTATGLRATGSVRLGVVRLRSREGILVAPRPKHHRISCDNLYNEFFEEAPTDWAWLDGAFRMDARWACQDQWNFLACGSTGVPMMVSKRHFAGEQLHEYFVSQRPVMPWDAGDASFQYDPDSDRQNKFPILIANEGWYIRRDLNLSLCSDGRNPLSGYAILLGADDNQETRLLRKGVVVARTSDPAFLFPTQAGFGVVHYFWRRISVWKKQGRLRVWINDRPAFDFTDPEPIPAGHVAFWSVRNGFAITKASSLAESVSWRPDVLYVPPVVAAANGWTALATDATRVVQTEGDNVTFARTSEAGFAAVRYHLRPSLTLYETPVLELPLKLDAGVALNLHVHTSVGSFLVPVTAPSTGMKALLTPDFERGECFRLPDLTESVVRTRYLLTETDFSQGRLRCDLRRGITRLRGDTKGVRLLSLTLGNSSNKDYLLAGALGDPSTSHFTVGKPVFRTEESAP